ncbi:MAG: glycerate 2-kinase [Halioglobus sp.]|jgi:glycerate 2-kinase
MTAGWEDPSQFLLDLFQVAVSAAHPHHILDQYLPKDKQRSAIVIGAGKAAAAMANALEAHWEGELSGLVVIPYGHCETCLHIEIVEAAHPVPDEQGEIVARRMLDLVANLNEDDLVICLLSGGGSSLLALPAPGISLKDKQSINTQLLRCGAAIDEMNCVRKHLSAIKGGQLARACVPAKLLCYAISDVPNDQPTVIASGPTVADPTTALEALAILQRYEIEIGNNVSAHLHSSAAETLNEKDPVFDNTQFHIIASAHQSLHAAADTARAAEVEVLILGENIEGEAVDVARIHAEFALDVKQRMTAQSPPCLILSGGETTVTMHGEGRGGRNSQFLLGLAIALKGEENIYAIAADTDGIDGSENNAGAVLSPESWKLAAQKNIDPQAMLADNNAYDFFAALDGLIITGPTRTNVNDFRAILVLPPA